MAVEYGRFKQRNESGLIDFNKTNITFDQIPSAGYLNDIMGSRGIISVSYLSSCRVVWYHNVKLIIIYYINNTFKVKTIQNKGVDSFQVINSSTDCSSIYCLTFKVIKTELKPIGVTSMHGLQ